jgi:hypothetical protein
VLLRPRKIFGTVPVAALRFRMPPVRPVRGFR